MKKLFLASVSLMLMTAVSAHAEDKEFPATLAAHVVLPANSIIPAPADAPKHLQTSAKFIKADRSRTEGIGTMPGMDGKRATGLSMPFDGQAMQGFSGIKAMSDGTFWSLSDNGFGKKANSSDSMLMLHHLAFDWKNGKVNVLKTLFLSDPEMKAPFPIVTEASDTRYLTGADFDVESIQPVEDGFWIGEEFGPYILKFNRDGQLTDVIATVADGKPVTSPDNPMLQLPGKPVEAMPTFNLKRSGGYEGMAIAPDGSKLYALLEGPLFKEDGSVETAEGQPALRILELDVASKAWTGRSWLYPLAEGGEAIGDFNMLDATTGLVIERDNGEGVAAKACKDGAETGCFPRPSKVKRIYKIEMTDENAGGAARKIGYIDLLKIADPNNTKLQGGGEGFYDMPFVTIENVDRVDETHIIVGNDNNLPFSAGRAVDKADDNEFVLLEVGEFLTAK